MAKKQQRPKPPKPLCVYCGIREAETDDHVIARCFFKVRPSVGTITVPCCDPCNNRMSKDEDYLADYCQTYHLAYLHHPVARELADGRVLRSAQQHSHFARDLRENFPQEIRDNPELIPDEGLTEATMDGERYTRALQAITRGLYAHFRKPDRLPQDCKIQVLRIPDEKYDQYLNGLAKQLPEGPIVIGDDIVTIFYGVAVDNPFATGWIIIFYRAVMYSIFTAT